MVSSLSLSHRFWSTVHRTANINASFTLGRYGGWDTTEFLPWEYICRQLCVGLLFIIKNMYNRQLCKMKDSMRWDTAVKFDEQFILIKIKSDENYANNDRQQCIFFCPFCLCNMLQLLIFDNGVLPSPFRVYHGLINYKETKTKCRHLKNDL